MTDYSQAAAELDWFTAKLKNLIPVSEELRRVGSLENAGKEAQMRLDNLKAAHNAEIAQHGSQLTDLKTQIAQYRSDFDAMRKAGDAEIGTKNKTIADLQARLEQAKAEIEQKANAEALVILDGARARGAKLIEDAKAAVAPIEASTAAKRQELADLLAKVESAAAKHTEIIGHIAALKAKLG